MWGVFCRPRFKEKENPLLPGVGKARIKKNMALPWPPDCEGGGAPPPKHVWFCSKRKKPACFTPPLWAEGRRKPLAPQVPSKTPCLVRNPPQNPPVPRGKKLAQEYNKQPSFCLRGQSGAPVSAPPQRPPPPGAAWGTRWGRKVFPAPPFFADAKFFPQRKEKAGPPPFRKKKEETPPVPPQPPPFCAPWGGSAPEPPLPLHPPPAWGSGPPQKRNHCPGPRGPFPNHAPPVGGIKPPTKPPAKT